MIDESDFNRNSKIVYSKIEFNVTHEVINIGNIRPIEVKAIYMKIHLFYCLLTNLGD